MAHDKRTTGEIDPGLGRRDLLALAAVAGAATLLGDEASADASMLRPAEMDAFLGRLDRNLAAVSAHRSLGDLIPELPTDATAAERELAVRSEALLKASLRSLLLTGVLQDLPAGSRQHPGIQARLQAALPEMDEAVFGNIAWARSLTPADRLDISATIEDDPDLPLRAIQALDDESARIGISRGRRIHFRSLGTEVAWRLKHQSPGALIDEYSEKCQRLAGRVAPADIVAQHLLAREAELAFFRARLLTVEQSDPGGGDPDAPRRSDPSPMTAPPAPPASDDVPMTAAPPPRPYPAESPFVPLFGVTPPPRPSPQQQNAAKDLKTSQVLLATGGGLGGGGTLLGGGFILGLISASSAASGTVSGISGVALAMMFGVTAGALMLLAGIILLIIGGVMYAQARRRLPPGR